MMRRVSLSRWVMWCGALAVWSASIQLAGAQEKAGKDAAKGAQEKSVKPGINAAFKNPNVKSFIERFEREGREIYEKREAIAKACGIAPGKVVADVGAGTGFYSRLFAKMVGPEGKVFAVDIAKSFLDHIAKTAKEECVKNIETILCTQDDSKLPPNSVDIVFICDAYHHFEYPKKTMATIYRALKPGGTLCVIDFHRIEGKTSDWIMNHVRAGQGVFRKEIESVGFEHTGDVKGLLKSNYLMRFRKPAPTQ